MNRNLLSIGICLLSLMLFVGAAFAPASSAAIGSTSAKTQHKSPGLTLRNIAIAGANNAPSQLVKMAPQSSLKLLSRAFRIGLHAKNAMIDLTVGLKLRNKAKLKSFLERVQNPASAVYHQWLTPAEFTKQYGPTKAQVRAVKAFLRNYDIQVKNVSSNRLLIHTRATADQYDHAFQIKINDYRLDGRRFYSTEDRPQLPRSIAPLVVNIIGLNRGVQMHPHSVQRPLPSAHELNPHQAPPASLTNLNPLQIAHAYNYPDTTDGTYGQGVNVAILTAVSSGLANLSAPHDFWAAFGLPDHTVNVIPVDGDNGDAGGMGETLLDVEYSGAMGPGITQNVYVAADTHLSTFTDMFNQFVNDTNPDGTAKNQVMTISWGSPETNGGNIDISNDQIFMQAAAEGISMFAAAGDHGSGDATGLDDVADYPSSSLYITAANGTQLNISDLAGDYGSEVVWNDANCFGNGRWATGGAVSRLFDKPDWQRGPGVPADIDMRMNSDMAATASCTKPMLVVNADGQWTLNSGTSAVAPQFAGMFAIAVAENGGPLGQSNELIYTDANGHYASDFHDVTEGNNGAFEAAPTWDHPTGWGSPNVKNLLSHIGEHGPQGTLTGAVIDAASGASISRALVISGDYNTITRADGSYSLVLPTSAATATASAYGYQKQTRSITITNGGVTTQNFALQPAANATISGKVTDGGGHGYGLYAHLKVTTPGAGEVASLWTNPADGSYSVQLPKGSHYVFTVDAALPGYERGNAAIDLTGNTTQDFVLDVAASCTAPGYSLGSERVIGDAFGGGAFPSGWARTSTNDKVAWKLDSADGGGAAMVADSGAAGAGSGPYDARLVSPPVPVGALGATAVLNYRASFVQFDGSALDLEISTDDGKTWTTISHWRRDHGSLDGPKVAVHQPLGAYLPASGSLRFRWRYYNLKSGHDFFAAINHVTLTATAAASCEPVAGSLLFGQVTRASTGEGLVHARVSDGKGGSTTTIRNVADPDFSAGSYLFFVPQGKYTFSVSKVNYETATADVTVPNNQVVARNFSLKAPVFVADPDSLDVHVMVNKQKSATLTIKNVGDGRGVFHIRQFNSPAPRSHVASAPLQRIPLNHPAWAVKSMTWISAHAGPGDLLLSTVQPRAASDAPHAGSWNNIADLPAAIQNNMAATDYLTGLVYSIYGYDGSGFTGAGFVYNPGSDEWHAIATAPDTRGDPTGRFINGRLYAVGGYAPSGGPTAMLAIYDPERDSWSTGADDPQPVGGGAASAVLDGKLYVVGGCNDGQCTAPAATVEVYDPATDHWSAAAPYPHGVTFAGCGAIAGKLYCAGGSGSGGIYADGYVYDPSANSWSPIPDMPDGLFGAGYIASQGKLLIASGVNAQSQLTNEGYAYDPASDTWSPLPNANTAMFRGGSSCGFYLIGGAGASHNGVASGEVLPGYGNCVVSKIPWLTVAPKSATVAAGASAQVTLTFDGTNQEEYGSSQAYVQVTGSPGASSIVPLTVHWDAQPVNLAISGSVNPIGTVKKGELLSYDLAIRAGQGEEVGAASHTLLTYRVPTGLQYIAATGDASCAPSAGSGAASAAASSSGAAVVCDFGAIQPGTNKAVLLAVQATADADSVASTFTVSAKEPDTDPSDNSVTIATEPNTGPTGPQGPQGPKGKAGSGGFGGLGLLALLGLAAAVEWVRRFRKRSAKLVAAPLHRKVSMKATFVSLCLLPLVLGGVTALAEASSTDLQGVRSEEAALGVPSALRPVFYRALVREAGAAYRLDGSGCASLPESGLKACFDAGGAHFSRSGSQPLALHLRAWGRGDELRPVEAVAPGIRGAQLSYRHGALTEWWRVLPMGFEQGFTLENRPAGSGKLILALGASRDAKPHGDGLAWGKLSYGGLVVTDADGKAVPATLTSAGDRVLIAVDDAHAAYPLTVDPIVRFEQKVTSSDGTPQSFFGYSVAISGTTALIGAPRETINGNLAQGEAYVFSESDGKWSEVAKLSASDGAAQDTFGYRVAIDGTTALVGASGAVINGNSHQGAAYVFSEKDGKWSQVAKLTASDGAAGDFFGNAVAVSGTTAVVGAPDATVDGQALSGAVYVFTKTAGGWTQTAKLVSADPAQYDSFGFSVAVSGSTLLIGANGVTVNGNVAEGAAYVFDKTDGGWSQTAQLVADDGMKQTGFGWSVAVEGGTALVGAIGAPVNGAPGYGGAYVFTDTGSGWSQTAKLVADDGSQGEVFGISVSLAGDRALVGGMGYNAFQGAAYLFTNSGGSWRQTAKLVASDGVQHNWYGIGTALSDSTALVGAYGVTVNDTIPMQGEAYFYGSRNLGLAVSAPAAVSAGRTFVSQTIATNLSSAASPAVAVSVAVPAAASFVSASATQGSCSENAGVVSCDFGSIAGNAGVAKANLTLKAPGNADAVPIHQLSSTVNAAPALTAGAVTSVDRVPVNLAILGNVSPVGPAEKGDNLNYVISVQNLATDSSRAATHTRLAYQLPDGLQYIGVSGDASCMPTSDSGAGPDVASASSGATITCDFGTIQAGGSKLIELVVQATQDADSVDSTFTVSAEESDIDLSNNSITVSSNPDYGETGPTGPQGPQGSNGDKGSGGLAFGGIALLALLILSVGAVETRKRRNRRQNRTIVSVK